MLTIVGLEDTFDNWPSDDVVDVNLLAVRTKHCVKSEHFWWFRSVTGRGQCN